MLIGKKTVTGAITLMLLFTIGCSDDRQSQETVQPVKVVAGKLTERTFQRRLRVQGVVQPIDEAEIASRTTGTLDILAVDEGDCVKVGQTLFQVDKENLENQLSVAEQALNVARDNTITAEAQLKIANTKQTKAHLDYERARKLIASNAISQDAFETALTEWKTAQAEVDKNKAIVNYSKTTEKQKEVELKIAKKNLADSIVKAPFDGIVTRKYKDQNEYVNNGTVIFHLENQTKLELSSLISAVYYSEVIGGKTRARIFFEEKEICEVPITFRSSSVDPVSRTFELKAKLPPNTPLISGTLCELELILEERSGLGMPNDAVMLRKGGLFQVYAVNNGKAEQITVVPGISSDGYTELLQADELKDRNFIFSGQYFLNPGDPVLVVHEPKDMQKEFSRR